MRAGHRAQRSHIHALPINRCAASGRPHCATNEGANTDPTGLPCGSVSRRHYKVPKAAAVQAGLCPGDSESKSIYSPYRLRQWAHTQVQWHGRQSSGVPLSWPGLPAPRVLISHLPGGDKNASQSCMLCAIHEIMCVNPGHRSWPLAQAQRIQILLFRVPGGRKQENITIKKKEKKKERKDGLPFFK